MSNNILQDIKKLLNIDSNFNVFDTDIKIHINSALATLKQLGVSEDKNFVLDTGAEVWSDFLGEDSGLDLEPVKTYVYIRVRILFDPPQSGYGIQSFEKMAQELEWRLNVLVDKEVEHDDQKRGLDPTWVV